MEWSVPKIWNGECWIICGGSSIAEQFNVPDSLVPETKDEFEEFGAYLSHIHNKRCIGVNLAAFLGKWVDVAYFGDASTHIEYRAWFNDFSGLKVSSAGKFAADIEFDVKYLNKDVNRGLTERKNDISWCCKNSGASAIDLAVKLGSIKIYILGIDMYLNPIKDRVHFHSGYPHKIKTPTKKQQQEGLRTPRVPIDLKHQEEVFNRQLKSWGKIATDCELKDIEVINVNPKSRVDVFPKMSMQEVLDEKV